MATVGYRQTDTTLVLSATVVERLDEAELDAVLAHELAHLVNRDATLLTLLSLPAAKATNIVGWGDSHPLLLLVLWPVVLPGEASAALVARHREYLADHAAARLTGGSAALASAPDALDGADSAPSTDLRERDHAAAFDIVPPSSERSVRTDDLERLRVAYWRLRRRLFGTHPPTDSRIQRLRQLG